MKNFLNTNKNLLSLTLGLKLNIKNMKKNKLLQSVLRAVVILTIFCSMSTVLQAQSISISADKTEIVLGESVVLTAEISGISSEEEFTWYQKEENTFFPLSLNDKSNPITIIPAKNSEYYAVCGDYESNHIVINVRIPQDLLVSSNKKELALGEEVTLNVETETGLNLGRVRWQKRTTSPDWFDMTDDAGAPKIGPSVVDTPQAGGTCYRAVTLDDAGSEVYSNEVCVTAEYKCAENSAHVLFTEDFGQLGGETERDNGGYGGEVEYINTDIYTYKDGCLPLKDEGTYAIMTNPKYAGYGDLLADGNSCSPGNNTLWFRDLYDHTSEGLKDGEWGAMLMVNAATLTGQSEQLVYSRTVDMDCPNTNMIFSAWFANASTKTEAKISMKFVVKDENGNRIDAAELEVKDIDFNAGWVKGETSFNSGNNTQLTVEIYNCSSGGMGNDFMVDDISFSVCTAEVTMSASSEDTSVKINAEKSLVEGKCGSEITLSLATGMADVIFDDPQYLWYVKGAGDSDFRLLNYNVNKTKIDTMITAWTEYYAVVTANIYDKHAYIGGNLSKCTPVAISNTYTVLCAPSMDAYLASQNCNKVLIGATVYDAAFDEIGAWWEKSTDGKNWQKIPRAVYHDTLRYEITEDTYFRLTNSKISSPATEKVLYRGISLTAEPSYGFYGTDVKLTAVTSNFGDMPNGPWYNWQRFEYSDGDWRQIDVDDHSKETINYTIEYPKDSIMVELYGCEATVLLKQVELLIDPMERECNTIRIQPIATIGGESTNYKWQSSSDGKNWVDVLEKNITKLEEPNCPECVEISFSEDCQFRIAAIDEKGKETGFYSEAGPDEMLKVKKLELKAVPNIIKPGDEVTLTLTSQGFEDTTAPEWYKDDELCKPITTIQLDKSASFEVIWDGCSATADVTVITAPTVANMSRNCNNVTFKVTLTTGYGDFWWETATTENGPWEKVANSANKEEIELPITEAIYVRVNNDYDIPSNAAMSGDVWELTLDIDPKDAVTGKTEIDRGHSVTLTANRDFSSNNPVVWYQDGNTITNTDNPYSPTLDKSTSFYVTSEGCKSNTVDVTVIQPVEIVVKGRECNNVTLEVKVEEGVVLTEYKWQISTFDSESSKWSDWSDYAGYVDKVVVSIDKDTKFQLVGDEISSEPTEAITYWSIELSIDKESIILGDDVTVTVDSKYIDASETILWYKNDQALDYDGDVYTEKPYGPASYQVTQGGCPSNVVNVVEVVWPTIFTPMAVDGFNDDFIIGMEPRVALQVFDRYGNLVVETTDGWDGKDKNGKYALPGVYYYIATLPNGEVVKGNVELLNEKK